TNAATITVDSGATLQVNDSTVDNSGTIALNSSTLVLDPSGGETTLTGGGNVTLSGGTISGVLSQTVTLHNVDNVIAGTGQIGTGSASGIHLDLINAGTIEVNAVGTLKIENFGSFSNSGMLEATNGGTLQIHTDAIQNTGTIAIDANSALQLDNPT